MNVCIIYLCWPQVAKTKRYVNIHEIIMSEISTIHLNKGLPNSFILKVKFKKSLWNMVRLGKYLTYTWYIFYDTPKHFCMKTMNFHQQGCVTNGLFSLFDFFSLKRFAWLVIQFQSRRLCLVWFFFPHRCSTYTTIYSTRDNIDLLVKDKTWSPLNCKRILDKKRCIIARWISEFAYDTMYDLKIR